MYCPQCGSSIPQGQKFCTSCGQRTSSEAVTIPGSPRTSLEPARSPSSNAAVEGVPSRIAQEPPRQVATAPAAKSAVVLSESAEAISVAKSGNAALLWGTVAAIGVIIVGGIFLLFRAHQAVSEADIVQNVKAAFFADVGLRRCAIDVTAQKGIVTLVGNVSTDADRTNAVNIVKHLQGVKQVVDELVAQSTPVPSPPTPPVVPPIVQARKAAGATWLGFQNGTGAQDREIELHQNCSPVFQRVYVPIERGNGFSDLCDSVGQTCEKVCDWEGTSFSCSAISQGGRRDGSRIALCKDKDTSPIDRLGNFWTENELGWTGTWMRRGSSNIFDVNWGGEVTALLTISMQGDLVKVERRGSSDGNDCDYQGAVAPDGVTVSGTYNCAKGGPYPWSATIQGR